MSQIPRTPVVYLAGGMRSNWQDKVIASMPGVLFIDPRRHGSKDEAVYTAYDLTGVERCDIVFGFIEKDNPNGAGLALEFGFACALGKTVIYVEEADFPFSRYFGMVRQVSDRVCATLEDGIDLLAQHTGFRPRVQSDALRAELSLQDERPRLIQKS